MQCSQRGPALLNSYILIVFIFYFRYETTATSLAFTAYHLDVQERLIAEILKKFCRQLLFLPEFCYIEVLSYIVFIFSYFRYETTATSLAFTAYLIAAHPDVQERLIAEIDEVIDDQVQ